MGTTSCSRLLVLIRRRFTYCFLASSVRASFRHGGNNKSLIEIWNGKGTKKTFVNSRFVFVRSSHNLQKSAAFGIWDRGNSFWLFVNELSNSKNRGRLLFISFLILTKSHIYVPVSFSSMRNFSLLLRPAHWRCKMAVFSTAAGNKSISNNCFRSRKNQILKTASIIVQQRCTCSTSTYLPIHNMYSCTVRVSNERNNSSQTKTQTQLFCPTRLRTLNSWSIGTTTP